MPIYEFKCKNCGSIFEYLCLRSDDRDNVHCPSCGHDKADMLFSTFSSMGSIPKRGRGAADMTSSSSCSTSGGFS